jgi:hypothetical protein
MSTFGFGSPHHGQAVFWSKERLFSLIFGRTRVQLWYGAVGIANRYGLESPRIESRWGEIFRTRPKQPWGSISLLYNGYRFFPEDKSAGAIVDYVPLYSAKVKERVEIYHYSPSWPVPGPNLPLPVFDSVPRDLLSSLRFSLIFTVSPTN